jgi:hypothetical protein
VNNIFQAEPHVIPISVGRENNASRGDPNAAALHPNKECL